MFRHIAMFHFLPETPLENIEIAVNKLCELEKTIESIITITAYKNTGSSQDNAQLGLVADFHDESGFETYQNHPDHIAVAETYIRPYLAKRTAMQFKMPNTH